MRMMSFSRAVLSFLSWVSCCCSLVPSAFWFAQWRLISSSTRCSSFVSALRVSPCFMVSTDSRVSFSERRI
ncbi:hypothetical protein FGO68_gene1249 [Halteria grandinella]|uniref:Secreted protein n=1 Tax=Halteria grandinella TaxID=5974 RepID=A0A8J8SYV6_HALGN|nr:hypothetical protein FGO68_gene1249 [Halteria grandinella]